MSCMDLETTAVAYFDGMLDVNQVRDMHQHLSFCNDCLLHFITYHRMLLVLQDERRRRRHECKDSPRVEGV